MASKYRTRVNDEDIRQFSVIDGGKEDPPITQPAMKGPEDDDWLRSLPFGSRFVCYGRSNRGCFLDNWGVASIIPKAIMLYNFTPHMGVNPFAWVDSKKFSRDNIFVSLVPINPPQEEEMNDKNNSSLPEPRKEHD